MWMSWWSLVLSCSCLVIHFLSSITGVYMDALLTLSTHTFIIFLKQNDFHQQEGKHVVFQKLFLSSWVKGWVVFWCTVTLVPTIQSCYKPDYCGATEESGWSRKSFTEEDLLIMLPEQHSNKLKQLMQQTGGRKGATEGSATGWGPPPASQVNCLMFCQHIG